MSVKIIASYDGTANEDDALALARLFGQAGAEVSLAYVRHAPEPDREEETLAQADAEALVERGAGLLGIPGVAKHVVTDRSTPAGLAALAEQLGASVIVFCSDSHTAKSHIGVGNSARAAARWRAHRDRDRPGGPRRAGGSVQRIVAVGDADGGAQATARPWLARWVRRLPRSPTRRRTCS